MFEKGVGVEGKDSQKYKKSDGRNDAGERAGGGV